MFLCFLKIFSTISGVKLYFRKKVSTVAGVKLYFRKKGSADAGVKLYLLKIFSLSYRLGRYSGVESTTIPSPSLSWKNSPKGDGVQYQPKNFLPDTHLFKIYP